MNLMFGDIADKPQACSNVARALRRDGRLIVSHPEGRSFVDQLRAAGEIFIESFPTRDEFRALLDATGLEVIFYRDEPRLFVMVARKMSRSWNGLARARNLRLSGFEVDLMERRKSPGCGLRRRQILLQPFTQRWVLPV
jgi:hypothetical protein